MTNNGNMPAMPCEVVEQYRIDASQVPCGAPTLRESKVMRGGMTKREMMAMHAMVGLLSCGKQYDIRHKSRGSQLVEDAVFYADALLDELERTE